MLKILRNPTYARLFSAQVVALLGTGLLTIALGLTAFDLAGDRAGLVLSLVLTIKMVAYVGLSPVATALVAGLDRRGVLIVADLVRAAAALCLPFIDAVWQIFALIFVLQAASATFSPTFQAVIPDILPDEGDYTWALSLSRAAYDIENLISPVLAGLLLLVIGPSTLFAGTALGFVVSALLVMQVRLPSPDVAGKRDAPFIQRLTRGSRIYLATPRLRGLLALNLTVACASAVVLVLSVVVARSVYGGAERDLAVVLGAFGAGSMTVALSLPRALDRISDRPVMLGAAWLAVGLMTGFGLVASLFGWPSWGMLLSVWFLLGAALAAVMTPSGRLLRRSAGSGDRPAIFAAQFALSHACWLFTYPLAGFLGTAISVSGAMLALGGLGLCGAVLAHLVWPTGTADAIEHVHSDLPASHPHLSDASRQGDAWVHRHVIFIDDEHRVWPKPG